MRVEAYILDMYCINYGTLHGHTGKDDCLAPYGTMPVQYIDRNARGALKQAREDGWDTRRGREVCPWCKAAKPSDTLSRPSEDQSSTVPSVEGVKNTSQRES